MDNYEVCKHVESVNSGIAVYVTRQCKKAHMMKGKLVVSKKECQGCTPVVSAKKEVPKCSECEFAEFEGRKCGPNRYYCKHPEARFARGETEPTPMICRTERHSKELIIKTSPRWCPGRKK